MVKVVYNLILLLVLSVIIGCSNDAGPINSTVKATETPTVVKPIVNTGVVKEFGFTMIIKYIDNITAYTETSANQGKLFWINNDGDYMLKWEVIPEGYSVEGIMRSVVLEIVLDDTVEYLGLSNYDAVNMSDKMLVTYSLLYIKIEAEPAIVFLSAFNCDNRRFSIVLLNRLLINNSKAVLQLGLNSIEDFHCNIETTESLPYTFTYS